MELIINTSESVPIFSQLIEQIKNAVAKGDINLGDALPSVRQLANDLDLNHNTVAKAYKHLIRDSIIESKGYRGTFIHKDAKANCNFDLNEVVTTKLTDTIKTLRDTGATDSEIRIAFANVLKNQNNPGA
ncbi:MAG: GntR family transcriptional regulator [Candidatus Marinimicrobia bacterium]|jgi:GntR family transcriptional regulator|nr:GntR family transcriptional regulator [Candidatus Neomarinimicrobiota bacterium]MBT3676915.1 GntR family transcriptional regulator [Candidatus Neomarinimicrobiota bacterium]MBT3763958.1 GntR family transcriptional regulator [Candidatus Neomarinimicrobiota bacterium]MBT4068250.1 GntR family transcriptional regulator [Candidatus Neomarinimicrobiota bacterium]MBT4270275.1 GntR family transcriptional regulator [Candidatus Neomarinimicrobiota bacterium]